MSGAKIALSELPEAGMRVIEALEGAGFEAWIVGGWVRDHLRGDQGHDLDVTTSALWQEAARVLRMAGMAVYETGTDHGTVTAVYAGEPVEVTTYRVEGAYSDHRHPDEVRFVRDVRDDLARRDFTVNAMAWHPTRGLLDPFGGAKDLSRSVIRAVGDPDVRFEEDALRVLRAVRFSARFGFSVEGTTQQALVRHAGDLDTVASERIGKELDALVCAGRAGRAMLEQPEVMCAALPELAAARGFDQKSVYHIYDVYEHIAHVCAAVEAFTAGMASPALRWAALLHDIAKPRTYSEDVAGHGHFFDHPREGARMARQIMRRLSLPSAVVRQATTLIRWHDEPLPATRRAVRALLAHLAQTAPGAEIPLAYALFDLRRADAVAKCPAAASWAHELDAYTRILREEEAAGAVYGVRQLAITGADVIGALGIAPGPAVGLMLDVALRAVLDEAVPNERLALLGWLAG